MADGAERGWLLRDWAANAELLGAESLAPDWNCDADERDGVEMRGDGERNWLEERGLLDWIRGELIRGAERTDGDPILGAALRLIDGREKDRAGADLLTLERPIDRAPPEREPAELRIPDRPPLLRWANTSAVSIRGMPAMIAMRTLVQIFRTRVENIARLLSRGPSCGG